MPFIGWNPEISACVVSKIFVADLLNSSTHTWITSEISLQNITWYALSIEKMLDDLQHSYNKPKLAVLRRPFFSECVHEFAYTHIAWSNIKRKCTTRIHENSFSIKMHKCNMCAYMSVHEFVFLLWRYSTKFKSKNVNDDSTSRKRDWCADHRHSVDDKCPGDNIKYEYQTTRWKFVVIAPCGIHIRRHFDKNCRLYELRN